MWRHFAGRDFPLEGFCKRLFPAEGFELGGISPHSPIFYIFRLPICSKTQALLLQGRKKPVSLETWTNAPIFFSGLLGLFW